MTETTDRPAPGLVGMWFHTFSAPGRVKWQGTVVGIQGDYAVAQLFEWLLGGRSNCVLIPLADFADTTKTALYATSDDMRDTYHERYEQADLEGFIR